MENGNNQISPGTLSEELQQFFAEYEKATPEEREALYTELYKEKPPKELHFTMPEYDPELDPNNPAANPEKIREMLEAGTASEVWEKLQEKKDSILDAFKSADLSAPLIPIMEGLLAVEGATTEIGDDFLRLNAEQLSAVIDVTKSLLLTMAALIDEDAQKSGEQETDENQLTLFDEPAKGKRARRTPNLDAIAEEALKKVGRNLILQGTATNALTKMKPTKRNVSVDDITGTATIKNGDVTYYLTHYSDITDPRTSTYQLLDALTEILTDTGAKDPAVEMPISEYMEKRGLKDYKETRKQVEQDLETLFNASMSFRENRNGKEQNFMDMRICDAKGIKNGVIQYSFGSTFFSLLRTYAVMPNHPLLYRINGKRNPYSYFLLRKMLEHKNMNAGKKNENIIAVKTLLKACEGLPTRAEIEATDRHYDTRIIKPFERDLDALESALTWEYCHRNGEPLTAEELKTFTFETFENALILTTWKDYPDQTKRLADRQARIDEARAKKAATAKRRRGRPKKSERE